MANCYSKFAMKLENVNNKEYRWLYDVTMALDEGCAVKELDILEDEHFAGWALRPDIQEIVGEPPTIEDVVSDLYIFSEETFDIEALGIVLAAFLEKFRPKEVLGVTFACTCSAPRPDEFGGGAILVTPGHFEVKTSWGWLEPVKARLEEWAGGDDA